MCNILERLVFWLLICYILERLIFWFFKWNITGKFVFWPLMSNILFLVRIHISGHECRFIWKFIILLIILFISRMFCIKCCSLIRRFGFLLFVFDCCCWSLFILLQTFHFILLLWFFCSWLSIN